MLAMMVLSPPLAATPEGPGSGAEKVCPPWAGLWIEWVMSSQLPALVGISFAFVVFCFLFLARSLRPLDFAIGESVSSTRWHVCCRPLRILWQSMLC